MGDARRDMIFPAFEGKIRMDRAEIRDKVGHFPGKALPGHHRRSQAVGQHLLIEHLSQFGVFVLFHSLTPFRK